MTFPNANVSYKLSRWRKQICSYMIVVISDSSGRTSTTSDVGEFVFDEALYMKMNSAAIAMLNHCNAFNQEGIADARAMTADELQAYNKEEERKKKRWASIPIATEEEIDAYYQTWIDDAQPEHMEAVFANIEFMKSEHGGRVKIDGPCMHHLREDE